MAVVPDPAELAPSRDPAAYVRRPLLTGGFWVMMAFCALCLLAAVAVVVLGPRLSHMRRAALAASAPPPAVSVPAPRAAAVAAPPPYVSAAPDVADRVARLELNQSRVLSAAASALAASALSDAASRPAPFSAALGAVTRLLPGSPDALALTALASQGAPTRSALAAELSELGGEVATAARAPGKNASFMDRVFYAFSRVVSVRRVGLQATGADATISGAERAAADGDLEDAVRRLETLPESARTKLAPWLEKAQRRIEIDSHISALRTQAMDSLAASQGATP